MNAKKKKKINGISRRFLISCSFPIHEGGRLAYRVGGRNPEYEGGRGKKSGRPASKRRPVKYHVPFADAETDALLERG
jgi:hypothetical protein